MRTRNSILVCACMLASTLAVGCDRRQGPNGDDTAKVETPGREAPVVGEPAKDADRITEESEEFVKAAGRHSVFEIEMAKMAQQRAQIQEVKAFASRMIDYHSQAQKELEKVVGPNVTIPSTLGDDGEDVKAELIKEEAADFDEEYMASVIDRHQKAIEEYEDMVERTADPQVQQYAGKVLPELRQHLDEAKRIKEQNVDPQQKLLD